LPRRQDRREWVGGSKTDECNEKGMQWAITIVNCMVGSQALPLL